MGLLLRAAFAFAIAFAVLSPDSFAAYFGTPRLAAVKAELAVARPAHKLRTMIAAGLKHRPAVE
ncbi:MAG: hypothetical protein KGJ79_07435 [Alphaproteobacteria bacterium]|nr:hypothetical protein [Alphaproteobacteria bacterium]MDE2110958.1 hypothetical protein [Alphaproteobacteria bacterium]MDE2493643.1 hypothetical protein [Alphaproteobacteria bacterium]